MTSAERYKWEETLLARFREIGESVKDITPEKGHLSMTWFPDGHMDISLFSGERVKKEDGTDRVVMLLDAWGDTTSGELKVSRV